MVRFLINTSSAALITRRCLLKGGAYSVLITAAWKMSVFGVLLVHIFLHSDWIRKDTEYLYGPEKLRIQTHFMQWTFLLVEGNEIVNNDGKVSTIMNNYFMNITKHMNYKANKINHRKELVNILDTFKNHKSLQRIKLVNFHSKKRKLKLMKKYWTSPSRRQLKMVIFQPIFIRKVSVSI